MTLPRYIVHFRDGTKATVHSQTDGWDEARALAAKKVKASGGSLRTTRPAQVIAAMEGPLPEKGKS